MSRWDDLILYSQDFELLSPGDDMEAQDWTHFIFPGHTGTFKGDTGMVGECIGAAWSGGFIYTGPGAGTWADYILEFDVISYADRVNFGFRCSDDECYWVQAHPPTLASLLYKAARDGLTGKADLETQTCPATITSVKVIVSGSSIKIYYNGSSSPAHDLIDATYSTGSIGIMTYGDSLKIDNIKVTFPAAAPYAFTTPNNSEIVKRNSLFPSDISVNFKLNNGSSLNSAQDITKYITKISDIKEKLTKSSVNAGGVILPDLNILLNNSRGKWNINGDFFSNGFVEKSVIEIELAQTFHSEYGAFDESFSEAFDTGAGYRKVLPSLKYRGIISTINSEWNIKSKKLKIALSSPATLFTAEKIEPGIISVDSFANVIYKILSRNPFIKYMTIDRANINPGYDIANIIDNPAEFVNKKVKDVLDEIAFLSGSIYYINYDNEFIFESIYNLNPSSVWNIRGNDIISIDKLAFDWRGQYTSYVWDDTENDIIRSEMIFLDREAYQYRYREKKISSKYVLSDTNRQLIADNLLLWNQHLKRVVTFTCKWNPEIIINKYINLDIPTESIAGDEYMTWNNPGHNWNAGLLWGIESPGESFDNSVFWRIIEVSKSVSGEKMRITARVAGINPDDNL